ncbi:Galactose oxidase/kelch, beta-propeller [Sesbania bispinosa]|nr:Galactose oxidase/kelch, beta-propeller [Sesbania bispinosa]
MLIIERKLRRKNSYTTTEEVMESVPNLPQELLEDILTRLPYKSLMRFKSVCKYWYALFHDPVFLSRHLSNFIKHHNSGDSVLLRLSFPTIFGDGLENYKLFSLSATSAVETIIPKFNMLSTKFQISGHCNGILCLSIDYWPRSKEVLLYNPATREFRCLPDTAMRLKPSSLALAVGMGYDPFTDDYKVIRIWKVDTYGNNGGVFSTNWVEEYALSTDSWTMLHNTNAGFFLFGIDCFAMCYKRTYYWWAFNREDKSSIILALDMEDEVFKRVPTPPHVDIGDPNGRSLAVWNDSISLICCTYHHVHSTSIDIWVMGGFGAEGSWIRVQTIERLRGEPKPLVFWKGNELLMEMSCGNIKSYNVDTQEIKDVMVKEHTDRHSSQAVNYVASTVSLRGGNYLI